MFETINRLALIITPKQPVIDWNNKIFPKDPIDNYFDEAHDSSNIFLIPQYDYPDDSVEFVKMNFNPSCKNLMLSPVKSSEIFFNGLLHIF